MLILIRIERIITAVTLLYRMKHCTLKGDQRMDER